MNDNITGQPYPGIHAAAVPNEDMNTKTANMEYYYQQKRDEISQIKDVKQRIAAIRDNIDAYHKQIYNDSGARF